MNLIIKAAHFAAVCHKDQKRKYYGEPYIVHPVRVASRVIMLDYATEPMVCAAYLHDVIEDCNITYETLVEEFNIETASLVRDLTNQAPKKGLNREQRKLMDFERLAKTPRECRAIKLIDRIDNVQDMDWNDPFCKLYFKETTDLLQLLKGTDSVLELELQNIINKYILFY